MAIMPNPFEFAVPQAAEQAAASPSTTPGTVDAAAEPSRFVLDEQAFMDAIEPLPMFLQAPIDVVEILTEHGA